VTTLLFWLIVGHALCDYPLQGDFLARAKNHTAPIPGVPWYQALAAHALIQAGMVAFLTHSLALGATEFAAHVAIDYAKCSGRLSYNQDQALHVACKVVWVAFMLAAR
jgi:hypothetical protein